MIPSFFVFTQAGPRSRRYGPTYRGSIAAPEMAVSRAVSLWFGTYADAAAAKLTCWQGTVEAACQQTSANAPVGASAANAIKIVPIKIPGGNDAKALTLKEGRVILFAAEHTHGRIAANGNRRADVFGYWNNNGVLIHIGAYAHDGCRTTLVGKTRLALQSDQDAADMTFDGDEIEAINVATAVKRDCGKIITAS